MTPMPSPAQIARAAEIAARLDATPHAQRGALVAEAAAGLGISQATLYIWMRPHRATQRQRRADAHDRIIAARGAGAPAAPAADGEPGPDLDLALTEADARLIAATMTEAGRADGRQIMTLRRAVETLRTQGLIQAARIDPDTGEFCPLSLSAIGRGLRRWACHPEQLRAPRPHTALRTRHPNARWEVDASVCVVYYLPGGGAVVEDIDPTVHYRNRPQNLAAIAPQRVIRYVLTDHCSGVVRWRYYPHSESGAHTVAFLAWAMSPKADPADPFNGAPFRLVVDPGATAAGTVRRYCDLLEVELAPTKPKNPRAKGSVEQGQYLVERLFEAGLRFQRHRVTDFRSLNNLAAQHQLHLNATRIHTRHGRTRFACWMEIQPDQLRITEPEHILRALATEDPARPRVQGDLTIEYRGTRWDVADIPGANVGARLGVLYSPLIGTDGRGHAVAVIDDPVTGRPSYRPLRAIATDEWGFRVDAPVDGENYSRPADTQVDTQRKAIARLATGTTDSDAPERDDLAARRKRDYRPLAHLDDGRGVDPYREAETTPPQVWLPRRGTAHPITGSAPRIEVPLLDHTEAALRIAPQVRARGGTWGTEQYTWLVRRHPEGVPEDAIQALVEALTAPAAAPAAPARAGLTVVR